ncbi:hypothetical protein M514_07442 [Trichuris suis]|uniref:Uncharacterized protein n=1 Tax=Trichuris suis TaxID=68888 RepID=A0A085NCD6_9BILA|nr:hypothetical protein M513_07442 [Trichuris suis]KFD67132.1 hypothetical protein M514_07442 [Trichuris suis]
MTDKRLSAGSKHNFADNGVKVAFWLPTEASNWCARAKQNDEFCLLQVFYSGSAVRDDKNHKSNSSSSHHRRRRRRQWPTIHRSRSKAPKDVSFPISSIEFPKLYVTRQVIVHASSCLLRPAAIELNVRDEGKQKKPH